MPGGDFLQTNMRAANLQSEMAMCVLILDDLNVEVGCPSMKAMDAVVHK